MKYRDEKKPSVKNHKRTVTAQPQSIFNVNLGAHDSEKDQYDEIQTLASGTERSRSKKNQDLQNQVENVPNTFKPMLTTPVLKN